MRHKSLPTGNDGQEEELTSIAERLRKELGINEKALPVVDPNMLECVSYPDSLTQVLLVGRHLSIHATHSFPPTLAILGGLLAQDVLRALSRKDKPITNLLAVDTMGGSGTVGRWAMGDAVDR